MKLSFGIVVFFVLGACGADNNAMSGIASSYLKASTSENDAKVDLRSVVTRKDLERIGQPVRYFELPALETQALATVYGRNGAYETWQTADDVTFTIKSGVITATRGLEEDLVSADVDDTVAALLGRFDMNEPAVRIHRYLDGERQVKLRSFICTMTSLGLEAVSYTHLRAHET